MKQTKSIPCRQCDYPTPIEHAAKWDGMCHKCATEHGIKPKRVYGPYPSRKRVR